MLQDVDSDPFLDSRAEHNSCISSSILCQGVVLLSTIAHRRGVNRKINIQNIKVKFNENNKNSCLLIIHNNKTTEFNFNKKNNSLIKNDRIRCMAMRK